MRSVGETQIKENTKLFYHQKGKNEKVNMSENHWYIPCHQNFFFLSEYHIYERTLQKGL